MSLRWMMDKLSEFYNRWKIKWLLIAVFIIFLFAVIGYTIILYGGKLVVKEQDFVLSAVTTIETDDGNLIGELYDEQRYPVTIEQIPDHVKDAFIAIEDRRFYRHSGVDFKSVARAVYRDIIARDKVEGASTITQQLAKNLFLEHDKTWMRKTKEVMAAIYLEREFSKDHILELYLNKIYFGHGAYGIEAASREFFSKSVEELSISEGAMLAGLVKAPNRYSPIRNPEKILDRRNTVLQAMELTDMITAETQLQEQGKSLGLNVKEQRSTPWNDSYIDLVIKEAVKNHHLTVQELKRGGYKITVHLDDDIQQAAYENFQNDQYFPGNTEGVEGAFLMAEEGTGRIVSALGGRHYQLGDLNRVTVSRQPGSALKPLAVYGPAMMLDEYHPYSLLKDEQIDFDGETFANVDGQYDGVVSLYDALVYSKNVPAVWLLNEIGISHSKESLEKMNVNLADEGLSIALGGLGDGMTPIEMVKGYSAFGNDGKAIEPYAIERIYDQNGKIVFQAENTEYDIYTPQVAWSMTEILQRVVSEGTGKSGAFNKALAGKTGSTEHPHVNGMVKDAWFVGFTPQYVTALWMGYDQSDENHYLTAGSKYPTELTKDILTQIDQDKSLTDTFTKPDYVKAVPDPLDLLEVNDLAVKYTFGGLPLVKGKLTWSSEADERMIYRIYRQTNGETDQIGEVVGENEFIIDDVSLFKTSYFYVVPVDPNTKLEGERSDIVELSL